LIRTRQPILMEARETLLSHSEEETVAIAEQFAVSLRAGDWVGLVGPLGAGKSVFVRAVGHALGISEAMPSPSYTILNCHNGRIPLYHFDLYRVGSSDELDFAGLDPYFEGEGVCLIEWADKIPERWPPRGWLIEIQPEGATARRFTFRRLDAPAAGPVK